MDRDEHALSLVNAPQARAVDYSSLTEGARRHLEHVKWACVNLHTDLTKRGMKKRPRCVFWARELSAQRSFELSAERLRKCYDKWVKVGDRALINANKCGKPSKKLIPVSVQDAFWAIYLDMKDKKTAAGAWRVLMRRLVNGEVVAKGITWHTIFMKLHPMDDVPEDCPWGMQSPPPGWSLSNFAALPKPDAVTEALALRGIGAAKALLARHAGVNIDWATLRIGECYMIDDHDLDFRCIVEGQSVRLRLIVLREVRTRRILAHVVRPRLKEEDGTERSITRRDVQHLLAGWLFHFGIPRDFECFLHCENAAAAVTADFEEMLLRVTGGRLKIDRTALYKGVVQYGGYSQSGGTPTGKAIIESGFRLLDIELAHVRGATGRNYLYKPEEHQGRIKATSSLMKRLQALPASAQNEVVDMIQDGSAKLPFPSIWEAHEELALAIQRIDARTWHDMQGFLKITEFRTADGAGPFYPLNRELYPLLSAESQAIVQEYLSYPDTLQNRMLTWGRQRAESPAECWMRLLPTIKWCNISEAGLFELMQDFTFVKWPGMGAVKCEIGGEKLEFRGTLETAQPGQRIKLNFNADHPFAAWAQDEQGRVLGTLRRSDRVGYHDAETMKERATFKATELAHAVQRVRTLEMQNPEAVKNVHDSAHLSALINDLESATARPQAAATIQSEHSTELLKTIEATEPASDGGEEDAWAGIYGAE